MSNALEDAFAIIEGRPLDAAIPTVEPFPRPFALVGAICSEDQARAGGCCICAPNCSGNDPGPAESPCNQSCRWCYMGCPSDGACICVTLRLP